MNINYLLYSLFSPSQCRSPLLGPHWSFSMCSAHALEKINHAERYEYFRPCCFSHSVGLVINKEYRNEDFNIITDNEALAINLELSHNQNLILATIYCPNGNPNSSLSQTINNLSDNFMFVGDFNSKLEFFGCTQKTPLVLRSKNPKQT